MLRFTSSFHTWRSLSASAVSPVTAWGHSRQPDLRCDNLQCLCLRCTWVCWTASHWYSPTFPTTPLKPFLESRSGRETPSVQRDVKRSGGSQFQGEARNQAFPAQTAFAQWPASCTQRKSIVFRDSEEEWLRLITKSQNSLSTKFMGLIYQMHSFKIS